MAVKKYLDLRGLKVFFKKISGKFSSKAECAELRDKLTQTDTKLTGLVVSVMELTGKLDNLINPNNTKIAELETFVTTIFSELDTVKSNVSANANGNMNNGIKIGSIESKMELVDSNINELIEKCKGLDNLAATEGKVNSLEGKLYGLITEMRALKDQIASSTITEDRIAAIEQRITVIEGKL